MSLALVLNFLAVGIISFFRRDLRTYAVFALPLGYFLFHAIVTHSLNRYNEPDNPVCLARCSLFYSPADSILWIS